MKKTLLLLSLAFGSVLTTNAQILSSDNFNSLVVGNIGTDITGATSGQGGYFTDAAGGSNSEFQIVNDGVTHGNVFQLTGSATATGSKFMWRNDILTNWPTRTAGNEIIEVEFDIYTGGATTSKNTHRVYLYNADYTKVLVGFRFTPETKGLSGVAYYDNAGTLNNYTFNLAAVPVVLASDTWVRIGMSFNKTTGAVLWKGPGFYGGVTGAAMAIDPTELDYYSSPGTANAVAASIKFDNVVAKATNVDSLLGTDNFTADSSKFSVYPNPANNVVTISNNGTVQINKVVFTDINGRTVKTVNTNGVTETQINVAELNAGVYFMNIDTNEGTATKKIIKN